jgi:hypothetical protein
LQAWLALVGAAVRADGAGCVDCSAGEKDECGGPHFFEEVWSREENKGESAERKDDRERVQRHAEASLFSLPTMLWQQRGSALKKKLEQDADDD